MEFVKLSIFPLLLCITRLINISGLNVGDSVGIGEEKNFVHYPGDLLLGGLFPFHMEYNETTGICSKINELEGIIPLEAVFYVLDEINRSKILSFTLGFIALDTCDSHSFTLEQALHFIHSHAAHGSKSGNECKERHDATNDTRNRVAVDLFDGDKVVGLVTGLSSSVTISLAQLIRLFHLPQISFLSTSPLLSDKRRYDYFFRTVPSDVNQVRAIVEILKFYEWNHVSIVYSDDEYGNRALHELEQLAPNASLCIAAKLKIPVDLSPAYAVFIAPYDQMVEKLLQAKTRVVILFSDVKFLDWFFDAVKRQRIKQRDVEPTSKELTDFVWIGSDAWGGGEGTINEYPEITEGLITVQLSTRELSQFAHHYTHLIPSRHVCGRNPFYCKLWRECHEKENSVQNHQGRSVDQEKPFSSRSPHGSCMLKDAASVAFLNMDNLRDAIFAYVYALKHMHEVKCGSISGLCDAMRIVKGSDLKLFLSNVSFMEPDGSTFQFHDGSDGQPRYTIRNMQRHSNSSDGSAQYHWVEVGKYAQDAHLKSTLVLNKASIRFREESPEYPVQTPCNPGCDATANEVRSGLSDSCCWKCVKCEAWQYPENEKCINCPPGFISDLEKMENFLLLGSFSLHLNVCVPIQASFLDYSSLYAIPVLAVSTVGVITTLVSAWVMFLHQNTPIIKAAGREHIGLLLFGLLASYAMNFVILWQPCPWSCFMVRFIGFCYAICNSTVLIKIARIYRIFNTKESQKAQKLKYISPKSQIALTLGFVFVELVIVAVWMGFDWPVVLQLYPSHLETELVCSDLHDLKLLSGLCYPLMLLFPMAYFAFRTRTCPAAFAEARHTGYGIYLTFINVLTFVLIYIGNNSVRIRVLTVCVGLCLNATVILVSVFFTKVYIVVFRPHKNSKEHIMNTSSRSLRRKQTDTGSVQLHETGSHRGQHCRSCHPVLGEITCETGKSLPRQFSNPELGRAKSLEKMMELEAGPENSDGSHILLTRCRSNTLERKSHAVI